MKHPLVPLKPRALNWRKPDHLGPSFFEFNLTLKIKGVAVGGHSNRFPTC